MTCLLLIASLLAEMSHDMFDQDGVMTGTMVLGRVLLFHVREDLIDENLLVDTAKLQVLLFPLAFGDRRLTLCCTARLATRWDQLRTNDHRLRNPSTRL